MAEGHAAIARGEDPFWKASNDVVSQSLSPQSPPSIPILIDGFVGWFWSVLFTLLVFITIANIVVGYGGECRTKGSGFEKKIPGN